MSTLLSSHRIFFLSIILSSACSVYSGVVSDANSTIDFPHDQAYINTNQPTIVGTLRDENGNPVINETVQILIDGAAVGTTTSDDNGIYRSIPNPERTEKIRLEALTTSQETRSACATPSSAVSTSLWAPASSKPDAKPWSSFPPQTRGNVLDRPGSQRHPRPPLHLSQWPLRGLLGGPPPGYRRWTQLLCRTPGEKSALAKQCGNRV